jgi:formate-dependent phosphoribosylglycinamide formyltransferase (GAR transformylase)
MNTLRYINCEISLVVYEQTILNNLEVNCDGSCLVILKSENITFTNLKINSNLGLDINAIHLEA